MSATEKIDGSVFVEEHVFVTHHRGEKTTKTIIQAHRVNGFGTRVYDGLTDAWIEADDDSAVALGDMC